MDYFIPLLNRVQDSLSIIEVKGVPDKLWRVLLLIIIVLVGGAWIGIPNWCLIFLAVMIGLIFILAVVVYIYLMIKRPDYLRSESFHIRKQAIELLGDKDGFLPADVSKVINVPYTTPQELPYKEEEEQNEE